MSCNITFQSIPYPTTLTSTDCSLLLLIPFLFSPFSSKVTSCCLLYNYVTFLSWDVLIFQAFPFLWTSLHFYGQQNEMYISREVGYLQSIS